MTSRCLQSHGVIRHLHQQFSEFEAYRDMLWWELLLLKCQAIQKQASRPIQWTLVIAVIAQDKSGVFLMVR